MQLPKNERLYVKVVYFSITFSGKQLKFLNVRVIQRVVVMSHCEILCNAKLRIYCPEEGLHNTLIKEKQIRVQ